MEMIDIEKNNLLPKTKKRLLISLSVSLLYSVLYITNYLKFVNSPNKEVNITAYVLFIIFPGILLIVLWVLSSKFFLDYIIKITDNRITYPKLRKWFLYGIGLIIISNLIKYIIK